MNSQKLRSSELMIIGRGDDHLLMNNLVDGKNGGMKNKKPVIVKPITSSVLSQVQSFLPKLERANVELERRVATESAESIDIENVKEGEKYIEMDIALVPLDEAPDDDDDASDESDVGIPSCIGGVTVENIKLPNSAGKMRPVIEDITVGADTTDENEEGVP